jgi:hypothetical protein
MEPFGHWLALVFALEAIPEHKSVPLPRPLRLSPAVVLFVHQGVLETVNKPLHIWRKHELAHVHFPQKVTVFQAPFCFIANHVQPLAASLQRNVTVLPLYHRRHSVR